MKVLSKRSVISIFRVSEGMDDDQDGFTFSHETRIAWREEIVDRKLGLSEILRDHIVDLSTADKP